MSLIEDPFVLVDCLTVFERTPPPGLSLFVLRSHKPRAAVASKGLLFKTLGDVHAYV